MRRLPIMFFVSSAWLLATCTVDIGEDDLRPRCNWNWQCYDGDDCTIDECGNDGRCANIPVEDIHGDQDGDGYTCSEGDCNEHDPNINPGATEVCDGTDNNCNGFVDEGFDRDADGVSICAGDCDDEDAEVYPGAEEKCNGVDDDCDGIRDNCPGCVCFIGEEDGRACGNCGTEVRYCQNDCTWGDFGECEQGCTPDEIEQGSECGSHCGNWERVCGDNCVWSEWTCVDEGPCTPEQVETGGSCGNRCGHQQRTCQSDCSWGAWECVDEGECQEGDTSTQNCPSCHTKTCNASCDWGSCIYDCVGSQECYANRCVAPPSSGCTLYIRPGGHLYALCAVGRNWQAAKNACYNWGGYLMVVNSPSENQDVRAAFGNAYYWIAWKQSSSADSCSSAPSTYDDGWSTTYANHTTTYSPPWCRDKGEPNNLCTGPNDCEAGTDEDCATVGGVSGCEAHWNDQDCACEIYYVCEMDP